MTSGVIQQRQVKKFLSSGNQDLMNNLGGIIVNKRTIILGEKKLEDL